MMHVGFRNKSSLDISIGNEGPNQGIDQGIDILMH